MRFLWLGFVLACSSSDDRVVPPPPDAGATTSTAITTFAIDALFVGDSEPTAWKTLGYDLDGLTTTSSSTDVCTPGTAAAQVDAVGGIDNAWGSTVLPITQTGFFTSTMSSSTQQAILAGKSTTLLRIGGLMGLNDTATGLASTASMGASITSAMLDSTTIWPSITNTSVTFASVYAVDGTIVATDADGSLPIFLWLNLIRPVMISVHHPVITFRRQSPLSVVDGVIAGTLDANELSEELRELGGLVTQSWCGSGFDGVAAQIQGAKDIMLDWSNAPGKPCDAISIGLGFTARSIANDSTTVDASTLPNPCMPDAATD